MKKYIILYISTLIIVIILQNIKQFNFISFIIGYTYGLIVEKELYKYIEKGK